MARDINRIVRKNRSGIFMLCGGFVAGFLMALCARPVKEWGVLFFGSFLRLEAKAVAAYVNLFNFLGVSAVLVWQRELLVSKWLWLGQMFFVVLASAIAGVNLARAFRLKAMKAGIALWILIWLAGICAAFAHYPFPAWAVCALSGLCAGLTGSPAAAALPLFAGFSAELPLYICLCAVAGFPSSLVHILKERNYKSLDKRIILYFAPGMLAGFGCILALWSVRYAVPAILFLASGIFIYIKIKEAGLIGSREKRYEKK